MIAKADKQIVKLVPIAKKKPERREFCGNPMGISYIAPDSTSPSGTDKELKEFGLA